MIIDLSLFSEPAWLICAAALFAGCFVQTALGFGMSVVSAPIIIMIKPGWVPYVLTCSALTLSIINTWHHRTSVNLGNMMPAFIARIPGTILGTAVLMVVTVVWLQFFVACCVLIAVLVSFKAVKFEETPARMGWAGFFSGFMGTTTSIGGPPMALVMQHGNPITVRSNLAIYFTYSCVLSLIGYIAMGLFSWPLFWTSLSLTPIVIAGFFTGKLLHPHINAKVFRFWLLCLCAAAGVVSLWGSVSSLFFSST